MHTWEPLLINTLDISKLILLFSKFLCNKDLPQIVGLFHLKTELAYDRCWDKCGKAQ